MQAAMREPLSQSAETPTFGLDSSHDGNVTLHYSISDYETVDEQQEQQFSRQRSPGTSSPGTAIFGGLDCSYDDYASAHSLQGQEASPQPSESTEADPQQQSEEAEAADAPRRCCRCRIPEPSRCLRLPGNFGQSFVALMVVIGLGIFYDGWLQCQYAPAVLLVWIPIYAVYIRCQRGAQEATNNTPLHIRKLPRYRVDLEAAPDATCNICLEAYVVDSEVIMLPCFHSYHASCAVQWLAEHTECPTCRCDVAANLNRCNA